MTRWRRVGWYALVAALLAVSLLLLLWPAPPITLSP